MATGLLRVSSVAVFIGNDIAVDLNAPEGGSSYQPRATPWGKKWEQTSALQGQKHKPGKGFCTYSASFSCAMPLQGVALAMSRLARQAALARMCLLVP